MKKIRQYFNSYADFYGGRSKDRFRDIPEFLSKEVKKGFMVLDVGCGKGEFLDYLESNFDCQTFGVDISRKMLSFAPQKSNLLQADACHLPFKSGVFDVVYCDTLLHHLVGNSIKMTLKFQKLAVAEIIRVTKLQGIIIQELFFDFSSSIVKKALFYYLTLCSRARLSPFPGRPPVSIDLKSKKEWRQFLEKFKQLNLLKEDIYPHHRTLRLKLLGIREVGNIVFFFRKVKEK